MKLLHIDSSPIGASSASRHLSGLKMGPRQKEQELALGRHAIDELVAAADGV